MSMDLSIESRLISFCSCILYLDFYQLNSSSICYTAPFQ